MSSLKDGEPLSTLIDRGRRDEPDVDVRAEPLRNHARATQVELTGLFRLTDHLERLTLAARRLEWRECPSIELLDGWVRRAAQLYRAKAATDGRLRLTVAWTRPGGPPETIVVVTPYIPVQRPAEVVTTPVMIPWTGDAIAKMGSRFLYAVAEARARAQGADEALLIDREGRPVEGARSNLFRRRPGRRDHPSPRRGASCGHRPPYPTRLGKERGSRGRRAASRLGGSRRRCALSHQRSLGRAGGEFRRWTAVLRSRGDRPEAQRCIRT